MMSDEKKPIESKNHQAPGEAQKEAGKKDEKNPLLEWAWQQFAFYDHNSLKLKPVFARFQMWTLMLGVLATFLVLLQSELLQQGVFTSDSLVKKVFQYTVVAMPIIISILIAASGRFKPGSKSLLLRAAAEEVKREIFHYRVLSKLAGTPKNEEDKRPVHEKKMVERINAINNRLMKTDLNSTGLATYEGELPPPYSTDPEDEGFNPLTPEEYLKFRLEDQLNYYQRKAVQLNRKLKVLYWSIYIFGGIGTFLAAIGLELWVALTTSLVGVFTTYMEYQQIENNITLYNQSTASLSDIKSSWNVLSESEKENREMVTLLVGKTEEVLLSEHSQWLQQMEDALASLRDKQVKQEEEESE
ncbi:MAG: DUF4231 domain-containing protein [bacterium]|nr:DUF4231 domain-containing protein [bacterium]